MWNFEGHHLCLEQFTNCYLGPSDGDSYSRSGRKWKGYLTISQNLDHMYTLNIIISFRSICWVSVIFQTLYYELLIPKSLGQRPSLLPESSMPIEIQRNKYLLYFLISIITFSGTTVGVMGTAVKGRQELETMPSEKCVFFTNFSYATPVI